MLIGRGKCGCTRKSSGDCVISFIAVGVFTAVVLLTDIVQPTSFPIDKSFSIIHKLLALPPLPPKTHPTSHSPPPIDPPTTKHSKPPPQPYLPSPPSQTAYNPTMCLEIWQHYLACNCFHPLPIRAPGSPPKRTPCEHQIMIDNSGRLNPPACDDIEVDVRPVEGSCPEHQRRPVQNRRKLTEVGEGEEEEEGEGQKDGSERKEDGKTSGGRLGK